MTAEDFFNDVYFPLLVPFLNEEPLKTFVADSLKDRNYNASASELVASIAFASVKTLTVDDKFKNAFLECLNQLTEVNDI